MTEADDSGGGQCHGGVTEVTKESLQPAPSRNDIGVQEGDEVRAAGGEPGIAGRRGSLAFRMAQHLDVEVRPGEVLALIGVDEPSSTTMMRRPRNAAPTV